MAKRDPEDKTVGKADVEIAVKAIKNAKEMRQEEPIQSIDLGTPHDPAEMARKIIHNQLADAEMRYGKNMLETAEIESQKRLKEAKKDLDSTDKPAATIMPPISAISGLSAMNSQAENIRLLTEALDKLDIPDDEKFKFIQDTTTRMLGGFPAQSPYLSVGQPQDGNGKVAGGGLAETSSALAAITASIRDAITLGYGLHQSQTPPPSQIPPSNEVTELAKIMLDLKKGFETKLDSIEEKLKADTTTYQDKIFDLQKTMMEKEVKWVQDSRDRDIKGLEAKIDQLSRSNNQLSDIKNTIEQAKGLGVKLQTETDEIKKLELEKEYNIEALDWEKEKYREDTKAEIARSESQTAKLNAITSLGAAFIESTMLKGRSKDLASGKGSKAATTLAGAVL
jgi:predicted lactoylglutathione lyase